MNTPLVTVTDLHKSFGGVQALRGVSFDLLAGEIHAVCGENGAGKSTLNRILSGSIAPDSGSVKVGDHALQFGSVAAAEAAGVAILHQESTVFPHLNAEDNVFVGREPTTAGGVLLDRTAVRQRTARLLERVGAQLDQRTPLGELTVAERQTVALARALSQQCRLLILDEPTASLSDRETATLFRLLRELRDDGVTILYVSHRLEELFELADRVTVLRDGEHVTTRPVGEVTREELVRLMVGRELGSPDREAQKDLVSEGAESETDEGRTAPLLEVAGLSRAGVFSEISFSIRPGEVVGLGGLVGAGRSEVARALFGIDPRDGGTVRVEGVSLPPNSPQAAIGRGLALIPEDRQHQGLVLPMSVGENLSLAVLRAVTQRGLLSRRDEIRLAEELITRLAIRTPGPSVPAEALSGGNQQKVLLGKWLATTPRVLILDEPTRGVDVGAKAEVHRLIRRLASEGAAILLVSSELPELLSLSDRILVMREGRVAGELPRSEATQEAVLRLALPQDEEAAPEDNDRPGELRAALVPWWRRLLARREYGVLALLAVTATVVSLVNPAFLSPANLRDVLVHCAPAAIVACGLTLVVITREIDISVGSLMGLLAAVVGLLSSPAQAHLPVPVAVLLMLALGAGVGLVTGVLVTVGRVPSIIVTLGMLTALRGVTELLMQGEWITDLSPALRFFGTGAVGGVPVSVLIAAVVIGATCLLTTGTPLGRRLYAVGSSPQAAFLAGLSERRLKLFAFTLTGFLTGLATLVGATRLSVIESGIGVGFELFVVTCVVVGGTSINGGRGSVLGSTLGVLLLGTISTVLIFLRLGEMSTYWERAIQGAFILAAVLADHLARRSSVSEGSDG